MIDRISIITAARNSAQDIMQTMESVLAQDCGGAQLEYLVIDGASTDGTAEAAGSCRSRMEEKGIIFRIVSEPDRGIYDAMNKGIRLAGGDLVGFINSGDWYEPGALRRVLETFEAQRCDLMFGSVRIYRRDGSSFIKKARLRKFQTSRDWNHPAMFARAGLYKEHLFPELGIHDDYGFYLKMRKLPVKIAVVDQVLANFRMGGASNKKGIRPACRRIHDRYLYCYRANGYSRWYLIECIAAEAAKWLLG